MGNPGFLFGQVRKGEPMKPAIVILTHESQDLIENCLRSVSGWAREIVVVDDGSRDQTLTICKKFGCQIFHHDWVGFSKQRTYAAQKAKSDWIFYLDPDERLTRELKQKIENISQETAFAGFKVKRENVILGKVLKKGGWYPDEQTRLVKKQALIGWEGKIHEYPKLRGETGRLEGAIIHLTHRGINWSLEKSMAYTDAVAQLLYESGHPHCRWWHLVMAPLREFWQRGIRQGGLFENMESFITVLYQTFDTFVTYAKLWEFQKGKSMADLYREIDRKLLKEGRY